MTVSMRVMSAGDGYKYLLKTISAADGDRSLSTPLTRYYAEAGTPPGTGTVSKTVDLGLAWPKGRAMSQRALTPDRGHGVISVMPLP